MSTVIKDIRPALRSFLLADTAIGPIVGHARIFELMLPQGVRAASLVYQGSSKIGDHHHKGPSGLTAERMQIDAYAQSKDEATLLANNVQARIDGFRGTWPPAAGTQAASIKVRAVFFDGIVPIGWDDPAKLHRVGRLYMIHYLER